MMMQKMSKPILRSNKGMVTTDFIFSFLLASMFTAFLFAMCFSFTVVEVVQYISFSATRAALPSNKDFDAQRNRAQAKVDSLVNNNILTALLRNGWFNVTVRDMRLGETASDFYSSEYQMEPIGGASPTPFYIPAAGVRLNLEARILTMNLGPLGRIESESGNGFSLTLGSMMFREPNQRECMDQMRQRYQPSANASMPMEDTGC